MARTNIDTTHSITNESTANFRQYGGWEFVKDDGATDFIIDTTPKILTINGLDSATDRESQPLENGSNNIFFNDKINPLHIRDSYDIRIDLDITAKSGSPSFINFVLDIGDQAGVTIPIIERTIATPKNAPYKLSFSFNIFCLTTFLANGGRIFLSTDVGTVTVDKRAIFLKRDFRQS